MKIQLRKKTVVPVEINERECYVTLDAEVIDHFQRTNNVGILQFYNRMKSSKNGRMEITPVLKLLGSMIKDAKTNRILGSQFLSQFDDMDVLTHLAPLLENVMSDNLPKAKNDAEKK